jgi:hypothetical protein
LHSSQKLGWSISWSAETHLSAANAGLCINCFSCTYEHDEALISVPQLRTSSPLSTTAMLPSVLSICIFLAGAIKSSHAVDYRTTRHVSQYSSLKTPLLPRASFSTPIVLRTLRRASKAHALHALRASGGSPRPVELMGAEYVYEYLVNITIGSQAFSVIVDTGRYVCFRLSCCHSTSSSSDTWLARKGFSCLNLTGHPVPVSTCAFGTQGFDSQLSESFQAYPKTIFDISYGDGEFLVRTQ